MKTKLFTFGLFLIAMLSFQSESYSQNYGWKTLNSQTNVFVSSVFAISLEKVIIVGFNGVIKTSSNGGTNWTSQNSGVNSNLHDVFFLNESNGIIIGENGVILYTSNGGATWSPRSSGTFFNLNRIRFIKVGGEVTNTGLITGSGGVILKTTDGGNSWFSLNSGSSAILHTPSSPTMQISYAVGYNGVVLKTTNGGSNWFSQNSGINTGLLLFEVDFVNKDTGIAVAGTVNYTNGYIYKTTNGGTTWVATLSNYSAGIHSIKYHSSMEVSVVGNNGSIFRSYDGGNTWTVQTCQSTALLKGLAFFNPNIGYATGENGTVVKTMSGGLVSLSPSSSFLPEKFSLKQNFPNPFNPATKINFDIKNSTFATLKVYDMTGKEVKSLVNENIAAGSYEVNFNASELNSGVYFYTLKTNEFTETKKMMLVK